jgi:hypothetical protein
MRNMHKIYQKEIRDGATTSPQIKQLLRDFHRTLIGGIYLHAEK